jgi:ABC-2 type transport system ATP-binding protein
MENAIALRALCKRYRGFALEDVSFDVPRGTIMGLIGPNGAGKTTLIKLIMGLIRPDAGEIRLLGTDARKSGAVARSRIGFVYETPCFPEDSTLTEIRAAVAPFYARWDQERFAALVAEFELPARKRFKHLSQGMQTKLALAVALSHHAELLVMDEPTSGLDPLFRRALLEKLADIIQDAEVAVLFSTHITTDLERIADYVTFIRDGRLVFSAPKDEVLASWGIVRGGDEILVPETAGLFRGVRRGAYGVEALTPDVIRARAAVGRDAVIERATLDDIMVYIEEGNHASEAHA